jgi:hypothetical protein
MTGDGRDDAVALDQTTGRVWVGVASGTGAEFNPPVLWDGAGCTAGRTCFVADVNGDRDVTRSDVIQFTKGTGGDVLVTTNAIQYSSGTRTAVDTAGLVGFQSSVAIGSDGRPIIAYRDVMNKDLRIAHCTNLRCDQSTTRAADRAGDTGVDPAIAVGRDGLPIVAYQHITDGNGTETHDLVVRHCADLLCTTGHTKTYDMAAHVQGNIGITIGGDGLPLVVYSVIVPGGSRQVRALHCLDLQCVNATIALVADTGFSVPATPEGSRRSPSPVTAGPWSPTSARSGRRCSWPPPSARTSPARAPPRRPWRRTAGPSGCTCRPRPASTATPSSRSTTTATPA